MTTPQPKYSVLVTGASGFIGSRLCELALAAGYDVYAALRPTSSRRYIAHLEGLHVLTLTLTDPRRLADELAAIGRERGRFDFVVHAAGATKCLHESDFRAANVLPTRHLVEALRAAGMVPRLMVYISSLSVLGPIHERDGQPLRPDDTPCPNTAYGRSKRESEEYLRSLAPAFPSVILRPTGVYGPRERDYFIMAQSIRRHTDFAAGLRPQQLTFVYVDDVCQAVLRVLSRSLDDLSAVAGRIFHLSDGQTYTSREFSRLLQQELGVRIVLRLVAPLWLLRAVCAVGGWLGRLTGRPSTLNPDKARIMSQRNWQCDTSSCRRLTGYAPQFDLRRGVKTAVAWYRDNGWL